MDGPNGKIDLGCSIIDCFSKMVKDIIGHEMTPAMEYIDVMCEKLERTYLHPVVTYILWIHLTKSRPVSGELQERAEKLRKRCPGIEDLRTERFENCLTEKSMTDESKHFFIMDFLKNKVIIFEPTERVGDDSSVKIEVIQDMLDIKGNRLYAREGLQVAAAKETRGKSWFHLLNLQIGGEIDFLKVKSHS